MASTDKQEQVEEREAWEQLPDEPYYWFVLFTEYRQMGPKRNLRKFYRQKREEKGMSEIGTHWGAPSNWNHYYHKWRWKERAQAWDEVMREKQDDVAEEILTDGLALSFHRVESLTRLAKKLEEMIMNANRPSPYLIEQYRGVLDDIAKEKGERGKEMKLKFGSDIPMIETQWGRGGSASEAWERPQIPSPGTIDAVLVTEEGAEDGNSE